MSKKIERLIRLVTYDPLIITTDEYEQLRRETLARILVGDIGIGERICARLLYEHEGRYCIAKAQNEAQDIPISIPGDSHDDGEMCGL